MTKIHEIRELVADGWSIEKNSGKIIDTDLAFDISDLVFDYVKGKDAKIERLKIEASKYHNMINDLGDWIAEHSEEEPTFREFIIAWDRICYPKKAKP